MSNFKEFKFSGVPGSPHSIMIDLDSIKYFNECLAKDGHYNRTNIGFISDDPNKLDHLALDILYDEFKQIMKDR